MATGSVTVNITIPVTNAKDPNYAGRGIAAEMLEQAKIAIGAGVATSGNLIRNVGDGNGLVIIGTWTFAAGT